jgi:hypothetical protein
MPYGCFDRAHLAAAANFPKYAETPVWTGI